MTTEEKIDFCKWAIKQYVSLSPDESYCSRYLGLCHLFARYCAFSNNKLWDELTTSCGYEGMRLSEGIVKMFPELFLHHRPKNGREYYWFAFNKRGIQKRIDILGQVIKELKFPK